MASDPRSGRTDRPAQWLWLEAELARSGDTLLQGRDVHVEGRFVHIDKHRRRARERNSPVAQNVNEDKAPRRQADALRHQHHQKSISPAGAGDNIFRAAVGREIRFKLRHLRPVDELAVGQHARNGVVDLRAETRRCAPMSMKATGSDRRCWFMVPAEVRFER
jgi:hypothetical protein